MTTLRLRPPSGAVRLSFVRAVAELQAEGRTDARSRTRSSTRTDRWTDGEVHLGRLDVRHRLTPALVEVGGHIGYAVRPSARRRGHATAMLGAALPVARALGIGSALVTCDVDNAGSRRVVEDNGGVLEDRRGTELRFWVPT